MKDLQHLFTPVDILLRFKTNPDEIRANDPIAFEQLRILYHLYLQVKDLNENDARSRITQWLKLTIGDQIPEDFIYQGFRNAIHAAKDFREALNREFIPESYRYALTSEGVIRPTRDPLQTLMIMWNPPGDQRYAVMRSFEANLLWHLGLRYLLMKIYNFNPGHRLRQLTIWLENNFFANDITTLPLEKTIHVEYDHAKHYRFVKILKENETAEHSIRWNLVYRFIKTKDRVIPVLYDSRDKKEEDIFRKTLLNSTMENPMVNDLCGITLVFFSDQDFEDGYEALTGQVFSNNAAFANYRIDGIGGKKLNKYSAGIYHPDRHFLTYFQGGVVEVQIYKFSHFFNRKFSLGPENHYLYRLEQIKPLLKTLFPQSLTNINWEDKNLEAQLVAFQKHRVEAHFI